MSRKEPTQEEQEYIAARVAYEDACLGWHPGQPWPHPPTVKTFGWRPAFPSDDPKVYEIMLRGYVEAGRHHRTGVFPVRPKHHPGRVPRIDSATGSPLPQGRPRIFERGQRVVVQLVLDLRTAEALDKTALLNKQTRSEWLRNLIAKGLPNE